MSLGSPGGVAISNGSWVGRYSIDGEPTTDTAHLVESTIETRAVTKCGRQLEAETEHGYLADQRVQGAVKLRHCKKCDPPNLPAQDAAQEATA